MKSYQKIVSPHPRNISTDSALFCTDFTKSLNFEYGKIIFKKIILKHVSVPLFDLKGEN